MPSTVVSGKSDTLSGVTELCDRLHQQPNTLSDLRFSFSLATQGATRFVNGTDVGPGARHVDHRGTGRNHTHHSAVNETMSLFHALPVRDMDLGIRGRFTRSSAPDIMLQFRGLRRPGTLYQQE